MTDAAALARLAGAYRLRPGRHPAIVGERPVLQEQRLSELLRGWPAARVPDACAALFTLCSHAHQRCSEAATAVAQGRPAMQDAMLLAFETARDHLRAVALEWPARAGTTPDLAWLHDIPLRIAGPAPADARTARTVLGGLGDWLADRAATLPPARWLTRARSGANLLPLACEPLRVLDANPAAQEANLRELAAALSADPGFAQLPQWRSLPRENGPWARQRHADGELPTTAWMRLAARWVELVDLATSPRPEMLLQSGALALARGEAIAWCEMARGLLFHWVRLAPDGTVADYRVLAPTEWNFHPQGALARALEALPADDDATATLLAAAFDPCVPCSLATP